MRMLPFAKRLAVCHLRCDPKTPVVGTKAAFTVNDTPVLETPPTVTTTFPVVAPSGTTTPTLEALQLGIVTAFVPLKVTVLLPWLVPKLLPEIVTSVPADPAEGERL